MVHRTATLDARTTSETLEWAAICTVVNPNSYNFSSGRALVSSSLRPATRPRQPPFGMGIALSGGLWLPRAFRLPAFAFWPSCARCGYDPLLRWSGWIAPDHNGVATFRIGKRRRVSWPLDAGSRAPSQEGR